MISIIIPTLNRPKSLKNCLEVIKSEYSKEQSGLEVVIVDSSENNDSELTCKGFEFVNYLKSDIKNRSLQRNFGIRRAMGDILAFLDDDSYIKGGWLTRIIENLNQTEIDAIGGLVIDKNQEKSEYYGTGMVGRIFDNGLTIANFNSPIEKTIEVDWLAGGNMAFKRKVFERISGFDRTCIGTAGYEETDLCIRAKQAGFKIFFDPKIVIDHVRGQRFDVDRNRNKFSGRYYASRNYTYFLLKNFGLDIRKMFFIYCKETYWHIVYFFRKPTMYNFLGIFANLLGKAFGTLLAIKYHLLIKPREEPLLK